MRKLLIAIDYSLAAEKVAMLGNELGKAMNAEIVLLHVIEDIQYYDSAIYNPIMGYGGFTSINFLDNDVLNSIEKEANHFLEKTKLFLGNMHIKTKVCHGSITSTIIQSANDEHCQLIVIGTHSRNMLEELFLGSTAQKLLKYSNVPLYIIPIKNI